jgi:hypothetical protein
VKLPRFRSDDYVPVIHLGDQIGGVSGRKISDGATVGAYGTIVTGGRQASPTNLRAARQHFLEASSDDLEAHDGLWLDRASGELYEAVLFDPLSVPDPRASGCTMFVLLDDDRITFLRRVSSLEEVERAEREQAARTERESQKIVAFRKRQPQVPLRLTDVRGDDGIPTLAAAAQRIDQMGGKIERGSFGELRITVPERLSESSGFEAVLEIEARRSAAAAAQTLAAAERVVLAAVDELAADSSKQPRPLFERLPNVVPSIGGGV